MLWLLADLPLAAGARDAIADPSSRKLVSAASIWEAAIKIATGRLPLQDDLVKAVDDSGFERVSITFEHARRAGSLPRHHGDPFDRMLVAQAQLEGLTLVTADRKLHRYEVPILDARG